MAQINDTIQNNMANQTAQARGFLKPVMAELPSDFLTYIILFGAAVALVRSIFALTGRGIKAPYAGYRSIFEPAFLVRLRFSKGALPQINEGYRKVCLEKQHTFVSGVEMLSNASSKTHFSKSQEMTKMSWLSQTNISMNCGTSQKRN